MGTVDALIFEQQYINTIPKNSRLLLLLSMLDSGVGSRLLSIKSFPIGLAVGRIGPETGTPPGPSPISHRDNAHSSQGGQLKTPSSVNTVPL